MESVQDRLESIESENQRLRAIVETTTDAILILDAENTVRFVNRAAEQLFGRSESDLVGTPFGFPVVLGETAELDVRRPDGRAVVAELRVGESRWDGEPARIASLRDCTERKRSEERERDLIREQAARLQAEAFAAESARLYQEAQQANRAKSDFLAIMSHELRTPLNAVIGYADLLLSGVPTAIPPAAEGQVNRIRASAHHLLNLIEEILTYTRMEAGRERVDLQRFDPAEVIHTVVSVISPLMHGRNVELKCQLPPQTTPIHSDRTKLQQILLNLLSNAVKFTDHGEVGVGLRQDGTHSHFDVWDTGIGIPPEQLEKVFEPFWQAEQSRNRRAEGTGIGLTVARRLAHLLHGELTVQSTVNKGTHFSLSIPPNIPQVSKFTT